MPLALLFLTFAAFLTVWCVLKLAMVNDRAAFRAERDEDIAAGCQLKALRLVSA